jgi:hypothetical protein
MYISRGKNPQRGRIHVKYGTALAPHKGPVFQADAHTVHGYLRGFISGQQASYWSADVIEKANGQSDILALVPIMGVPVTQQPSLLKLNACTTR